VLRHLEGFLRWTVICGLGLTAATGCSPPPEPAVDSRPTRPLDAETKLQFDVLFANELATWNKNSVRFTGGQAAFQAKEDFFRELAHQGYEIAGLFARVVKPSQGRIVFDREAYERLRALADSGDVSAMCFVWEMYTRFAQSDQRSLPYTPESEVRYPLRGAKLGHPLCGIHESFFYRHGTFGHPKDRAKASSLLLQAAEHGYYVAQLWLFIDLRQRGFEDADVVKTALCWGRVASFHSPWASLDSYVNALRREAQKAAGDDGNDTERRRMEYRALADEWDVRTTSRERKPSRPEECAVLAKKNQRQNDANTR
jgi:hypothetical protein